MGKEILINEAIAKLNEIRNLLMSQVTPEPNTLVNRIDDVLNTIQHHGMTLDEMLKYIRQTLYPPRGGLTDFFVWSNHGLNKTLTCQINKKADQLWRILERGGA